MLVQVCATGLRGHTIQYLFKVGGIGSGRPTSERGACDKNALLKKTV